MPATSDRTKVTRELERHGVKFTGEIRKAWEKNPLVPRQTATMGLCACLHFSRSNSQV